MDPVQVTFSGGYGETDPPRYVMYLFVYINVFKVAFNCLPVQVKQPEARLRRYIAVGIRPITLYGIRGPWTYNKTLCFSG